MKTFFVKLSKGGVFPPKKVFNHIEIYDNINDCKEKANYNQQIVEYEELSVQTELDIFDEPYETRTGRLIKVHENCDNMTSDDVITHFNKLRLIRNFEVLEGNDGFIVTPTKDNTYPISFLWGSKSKTLPDGNVFGQNDFKSIGYINTSTFIGLYGKFYISKYGNKCFDICDNITDCDHILLRISCNKTMAYEHSVVEHRENNALFNETSVETKDSIIIIPKQDYRRL